MSEADGDRPWTEEEWEEHIKRSDLRADRFGELLETLRDDPEWEEKVAKEMGWEEPAEEELTEEQRAFRRAVQEAAEEVQAKVEAGEPLEDDDEEDDVWSIPAYRFSMELVERIHEVLKPVERRYSQGEGGREEEERGQDIGDAFIGVAIAGAKLANGHGLGYEDDVLGGNIVQCRRALAGARQSIGGLKGLGARGLLPAEVVKELVGECEKLVGMIEERIAELRARVWW